MSPLIKITTLQAAPHLFPEVLAIIEDALDYSPPHHFATDFYPLIKKSNHQHLYVLLENNRPAAHLGLLPKMLNVRGQFFPIALVGGVATTPEKRGRGYFNQLITHVLKCHPHCMGYFLWGGHDSLYKKYRFYQMGVIRQQTGRSGFTPSDYTPTLYKDLEPPHQQQLQNIHRLSARNFLHLQRDWSDIEHITSAKLYIKQNQCSEITHYFFAGKGRDLPGIAHEIFEVPKNPDELSSLSCWMPDVPAYQHWPKLYGCLFKIGAPHLFARFIAHYSEQTLEIQSLEKDLVSFSFRGHLIHLPVEDFLCGLFGPGVMEEFQTFYTPLWFGGLDSI